MNQPAKATTVTIIGAGLGGIALVANLGLLGYRLRLHDRDEARIARVRERGGLDVEGLAKGFAPLELGWPEPTRVRLTIVKRFLQVASLPASRVERVLGPLRAAFPQVVAAPSILTTGLTNMNATLHVANMVGNIGRLEGSGNAYRFYAEGYTPSLITLLEALDAERLAVARAYGAQVPGIHQWLLTTYGLGGDSLRETFNRLTHEPTGPYQWTATPASLQHKYVIEDVPCGLVAMSELGRAAGVATPVIDGLITLTSTMLRRDFRSEGRNLAQLGLTGRTVGEIRSIVETGPTG